MITLTRFFQFTSFISILLFFYCSIIYLGIFVHTSNRFKSALFQKALQCLTQYGCNKNEMKKYTYFRHTINLICWGYLLLILSENFLQIPGILTSTFFFRECYFPVNLIPSLNSVMKSEKSIETVIKVVEYTELVGRAISFTAIVIILSPFVVITINIWVKCIHGCLYDKKIKYSTDSMKLKEPLIITK